jgi:solute carrier family 35 protein E3
MAERSTDRAPSIASSVTEAEAFDDNEKTALGSTDGSVSNLKSPEEMEIGDDIERAGLLPQEEQEKPPPQPAAKDNSTTTAVVWMVVNTLATIGIVRLFLIFIQADWSTG